MDTRPCGRQGLELTAQGLGCMSLTTGFYASETTAPSKEEAKAVLLRARELGIGFYNTAILYGPETNEQLIGETIAGMAHPPVVMTKWGLTLQDGAMVHRTDRRTARDQLEGQLKRLGVDAIDLWVLRSFKERETPLEETMAAIQELVDERKVRYVGLSECTADQLRRAHAITPVTVVEIEWSLWARENEADVIPTARELGIGIVPWGPLGAGFLTGRFTSRADFEPTDLRMQTYTKMSEQNFAKNLAVVERIMPLAVKKGCTPGQLALAWLHAQGDDVFPVPGTRSIEHLEQNVAAYEISKTLTGAEMAELEAAVPAHEVHGGSFSTFRKQS